MYSCVPPFHQANGHSSAGNSIFPNISKGMSERKEVPWSECGTARRFATQNRQIHGVIVDFLLLNLQSGLRQARSTIVVSRIIGLSRYHSRTTFFCRSWLTKSMTVARVPK